MVLSQRYSYTASPPLTNYYFHKLYIKVRWHLDFDWILSSLQIQVINGIILISWRKTVLQKQIDYGAKLGHVVLSLAKMELENFFKNVMPVADYFDQSELLVAVGFYFY